MVFFNCLSDPTTLFWITLWAGLFIHYLWLCVCVRSEGRGINTSIWWAILGDIFHWGTIFEVLPFEVYSWGYSPPGSYEGEGGGRYYPMGVVMWDHFHTWANIERYFTFFIRQRYLGKYYAYRELFLETSATRTKIWDPHTNSDFLYTQEKEALVWTEDGGGCAAVTSHQNQ